MLMLRIPDISINDEDEHNMDRECQIIQEKNNSPASNHVFQYPQWQHVIVSLLNFIDDNYFIQ